MGTVGFLGEKLLGLEGKNVRRITLERQRGRKRERERCKNENRRKEQKHYQEMLLERFSFQDSPLNFELL